MELNMQPFSGAFGDPFSKPLHVGPFLLPPSLRNMVLLDMERAGIDAGHGKGFNFGYRRSREDAERRKKFRDAYWEKLLIALRDYNRLYDYVLTTLVAAEEAIDEAHEVISKEISKIERLEEKVDERIERYGSTSLLRRLKRRLAHERLELEDQHDELHDYEREVLDPVRDDMTARKRPNYKQLLINAGKVAAYIPLVMAAPFLSHIERKREAREAIEAQERVREEAARQSYSQYWNDNMKNSFDDSWKPAEEEPEFV